MIRQIQLAMSRDQVKFDELDSRFEAVYAATNRAELDRVIADLPTPPEPIAPAPAHPVASQHTSLIGDVKAGGWIEVNSDVTYGTLIGDVTVDLSSATLPPELTITVWGFIGDTTVILPDGVRAVLEGFVGIGDRKVDLADPRHGAPIVKVKVLKGIGDAKLYSLSRVPEGRIRKLWRKLRQES